MKIHMEEGEAEVWNNIFPNIKQVEMCGDRPFYKVKVREIKRSEVSPYWGWKDFARREYCMIYPRKEAVEMCFPYGTEAEEKMGRGKLVNLVVTEIRGVSKK